MTRPVEDAAEARPRPRAGRGRPGGHRARPGADRVAGTEEQPRPGDLPAGAGRAVRPPVPDPQVPHASGRRRRPAGQRERGPPGDPRWRGAAPHQARRAAAAVGRAARRDEPGRAEARGAGRTPRSGRRPSGRPSCRCARASPTRSACCSATRRRSSRWPPTPTSTTEPPCSRARRSCTSSTCETRSLAGDLAILLRTVQTLIRPEQGVRIPLAGSRQRPGSL